MKHCLIVISFLYCASVTAQVDKIEHFYLRSPHAEELYHFFKDSLQLPVVFAYQTWSYSTGSLESGGLTMGNVVIEFVKSGTTSQAKFGIALQPQGSVEKTLEQLDAAKLAHGTIRPYVFTLGDGAKDTAWKTLEILNLMPTAVKLYYCDYKHRGETARGRKNASDSLALIQGGALGIIGVKHFEIGCGNADAYSRELSALPGIKEEKQNRFTFESGPSIQLKNATSYGISKIVIHVRSLANAKQYLQSKNIIGTVTKNSVFIRAALVDGVNIELVEK